MVDVFKKLAERRHQEMRCKATTKNAEQCKRAMAYGQYCRQHAKPRRSSTSHASK